MLEINFFNRNRLDSLIVFTFCVFSFHIFAPVGYINPKILSGIELISVLGMFVISGVFTMSAQNEIFFKPLRFFIVIVFLSVFVSHFVHNQRLLYGFVGTIPILIYTFYFFLIRIDFEIDKFEPIIFFICIIFSVCFVIAFVNVPEQVFGMDSKVISAERGFFRIQVEGRGFIHLGFFVALNKFVKEFKLKWFIVTVLLFSLIVLMVVRQFMLFAVLLGIVMILFNVSLKRKLLLFAFGTVIGLTLLQLPLFDSMYELTASQFDSNAYGENIRITAYRFFFTEFSPHTLTDIIGNGMPFGMDDYGKYVMEEVRGMKHLYHSDVGYGFIYANFGLISLIIWGIIFAKALNIRVDNDYLGFKYFIIFSFLSNILSSYLFDPGSMASIGIALYVIDKNNYSKVKSKKTV